MTNLKIEMLDEPEAAPVAQPPIAWEATHLGVIKYVTDERYKKFSTTAQGYYKPYRCSSCAAPVAQPSDDAATIAGLEASIGHLSALVDDQLRLIIAVEKEFGADPHDGSQFEDGDSAVIDRCRAHIAAMATPPAAPVAQPDQTAQALEMVAPAAQPLTDEEIDALIQQHVDPVATYRNLHVYARAVVRAAGHIGRNMT